MGKLLAGYVLPHPPIIISEVGRGRENEAMATIEGCKEIANDISNKNPDTVIVITPHGVTFRDALCISTIPNLKGSLENFGVSGIEFEFSNNEELVNSILTESTTNNIPLIGLDYEMTKTYDIQLDVDHGTYVPLYFIKNKLPDFKLVHISMGFLDYNVLAKFGEALNKVVINSNSNAVLIASGDLSHKLTSDAPAGYSIRGKEFDKMIVDCLKDNTLEKLMEIDDDLVKEAGQCGLRPIITMLGALKSYKIKAQVISYEGPFGVGYCTAKYNI